MSWSGAVRCAQRPPSGRVSGVTSSARARASVAAAVGPEARVAGEESIRWSFSLVRALSSMIADVQYRLRKWPSGAEASCDEAASLRMCLPPGPYLRRVGRVSGGSRRLWSERRRWLTGSSSAVEQRCKAVTACVLKLVQGAQQITAAAEALGAEQCCRSATVE